MQTKSARRTSVKRLPTSSRREEAIIRELTEEWAESLRSRDIDGIMKHYAPGVEVFGVTEPLHYSGAKAHRSHWEEMIGGYKGRIGYEIKDLHVVAGDDLAFSTSLNRISGKRMNGQKDSNWIRVTIGLRKVDNTWLVVHEHVSVPIEIEEEDKTGEKE